MQALLRRRPHRLPRCLGQNVQRREVKLNMVHNPDIKRMKHLKEDGFSMSTKPIIHDAEPVFRGRLQEHVRFFDKDYMHVTPEDEHIGLAIVGLHPETRKGDLRRKLMSLGTVRHCWIWTESVVLVRFQDPRSRSSAKNWLESLQQYPFAILDRDEGHWNAPGPSDWPKLRFEPLTTKYDFIEPTRTKILLFRSWFTREHIVTKLLEPYRTNTERPKLTSTTWDAHNKSRLEWWVKFPTVELATKARDELHGQCIRVPPSSLSTQLRVRYPTGTEYHLWVQHTGLHKVPPEGTPPPFPIPLEL